MNATIAYFTNRKNPRFHWFCDSLVRQMWPEDLAKLQVIFIDNLVWGINADVGNRYLRAAGKFPLADTRWHNWARRDELAAAVRGRFEYLHVPPKPCSWQGPFRYTQEDWFCAGNARNTAIILAEKPYLICVDDLSVLAPGWVDNARHAVQHGYVVAGAYKKLLKMEVNDGHLADHEENPKGVDSRWPHGSATGIVPWHGDALYGCSFGVPVELATTIDGFDAHCDGMGAEDYDFGIRLERAGGKIFYNRNMLTWESEEGHWDDKSLPRRRKKMPPERLPDYLRAKHPDGLDCDHVMLNRIRSEPSRFAPLSRTTVHSLRSLRHQWAREKLVSIPETCPEDWVDGMPLTQVVRSNSGYY